MYLNKINDKIADTIHIGIKDLQIKKIEIIYSIDVLKEKLLKSSIPTYFIETYLKQLNDLESKLLRLNFDMIDDISKLHILYKQFEIIHEEINKKFNTKYNICNINFNKRLFYTTIPFLITLLFQLYNDKKNVLFIDYIRFIITNIYIILENTINEVVLESTKIFIKKLIKSNIGLSIKKYFYDGNIDPENHIGDIKRILSIINNKQKYILKKNYIK